MKKMILFIFFIVLVSGTFSVQAKEIVYKKILIATQKSDFKQSVVDEILPFLTRNTIQATEIRLKNLHKEKAQEYDAIIILNSIWAGKLSKPIRKFLNGLSEEERTRIIIVNTANGEDWQAKEKGVHAITAASKKENISRTSKFIIKKISEILEL